ncbi:MULTISPECIES: hypothetical protein [Vibrio]|uniref:hypothetical protein n=1 Tax=Vibrio TaxID=662 RepID=UPI00097732A1|nr:hypothetical protein [Vibrio splendidus]OMO30282.1 hypothetical protein BH581_06935 [Vibrio splendidus]
MAEQNFTRDFNYLVALIQHLGCHEKWNSRTPRNIAASIGLEIDRVVEVLQRYPAFFRKSPNLSTQKEPLYSLHIRYARRIKGVDGYQSKGLSPEEMQTLLGLVTDMVRLESDDRRLQTESEYNNRKVWIALAGAFLTAIAAIVSSLFSNVAKGAVL